MDLKRAQRKPFECVQLEASEAVNAIPIEYLEDILRRGG